MAEAGCINPHEIEEGDLVDYLHGDASPQIVEHIAHCPFCAEEVEQLRIVDAQLLAAFYREACPAPDVIADFALGRLVGAERLRVAAHVRGCAACTQELTGLRDLTDPEPVSLLSRLRESLALALVARPVAHLAPPVRGQGWQGRFETDDLVITLAGRLGGLSGRLRRQPAAPQAGYSGEAWLLGEESGADEDTPHSPIDARGYFEFAGVTPGAYRLLLAIGERNITLEQTIQIE